MKQQILFTSLVFKKLFYTESDAAVDEKRGRSSTNASLEFVEDFFSDAQIEKEWEVRAAV